MRYQGKADGVDRLHKSGRFTCSRRLLVFSRRRSICWLRLHPLSLLHNDVLGVNGQCEGVCACVRERVRQTGRERDRESVCTFPPVAADSNHQPDEMHKTLRRSGKQRQKLRTGSESKYTSCLFCMVGMLLSGDIYVHDSSNFGRLIRGKPGLHLRHRPTRCIMGAAVPNPKT